MALKATVHKATLQIADIDRPVYATHTLTLARQPSETDERLMMRLLAFALQVPADDLDGRLEPALGMSDADEPDLWQRSLRGELRHWIEVGQPDERRLVRACGRAERVTLYCYSASAPIWWAGVRRKLERLANLSVWLVPATQSRALAQLAGRTMALQFTVQDGSVWVGNGTAEPVAIKPQALLQPPA